MHSTIKVDYPVFLADVLCLQKQEFEKEIRLSSIIKLYELGKISSGNAAKALDLSRIDFLEILTEYNVSYFDKHSLSQDIANA